MTVDEQNSCTLSTIFIVMIYRLSKTYFNKQCNPEHDNLIAVPIFFSFLNNSVVSNRDTKWKLQFELEADTVDLIIAGFLAVPCLLHCNGKTWNMY